MDNFILFILFFAFFFLYGALFLSVYVIWRKRQAESRRRTDEAMIEAWRPIFADCAVMNTFPERLPAIAPGALPAFMSLWLYWISMTDGEARKNLMRLGHQMGLHHCAFDMLASSSLKGLLLGMDVVGVLRFRKGLRAIHAILEGDDAEMSLLAARSLLRAGYRHAWPKVLREIEKPEKWTAARIESLIVDAELNQDVAMDLWRIARQSSLARCARLLRVIIAINAAKARPVIRLVLSSPSVFDSRVTTVALQGVEDPREAGLARRYLKHRRTYVRMAAASALGRVGVKSDAWLVVNLLWDKSWWTRTRAAEAIVELVKGDKETLDQFEKGVIDPYGLDALKQARERFDFALMNGF